MITITDRRIITDITTAIISLAIITIRTKWTDLHLQSVGYEYLNQQQYLHQRSALSQIEYYIFPAGSQIGIVNTITVRHCEISSGRPHLE
jgi:hypothetical protein